MSDLIQIVQLLVNLLLVPAVAYIIKLEKRLFILEHKVDAMLENLSRRRSDSKFKS